MTDELFDLVGRVAVVTGGLGQMGQVYTDGLTARGMRVAVFDVAAEPGGDDSVRRYRVRRHRPGVDRIGDGRGRHRVGRASHLLVNNAALDSPPDAPPEEVGPFETYPEASFDEVMDVNVKGVVLCCQVDRRRDGRGGTWLDRQRLVGLRPPVRRRRISTSSGAARARRSSSRLRTRYRSRRC